MAAIADDARRATAVSKYRASLLKCRELDSILTTGRDDLKKAKDDFKKTEEHVKVFQSTGLIVGEVLRPLGNKCFIVKASTGRRYFVNCHGKLNVKNITASTHVCLDPTSLTIMRILPFELDPLVFNMIQEDPEDVIFSAAGGLSDQISEFRETIEYPIMNPELFIRVGIKPPKGFNAADMRNVCKKAGKAAIRAEGDYAVDEDFMKGVMKMADAKKLESSADNKTDFGKD